MFNLKKLEVLIDTGIRVDDKEFNINLVLNNYTLNVSENSHKKLLTYVEKTPSFGKFISLGQTIYMDFNNMYKISEREEGKSGIKSRNRTVEFEMPVKLSDIMQALDAVESNTLARQPALPVPPKERLAELLKNIADDSTCDMVCKLMEVMQNVTP